MKKSLFINFLFFILIGFVACTNENDTPDSLTLEMEKTFSLSVGETKLVSLRIMPEGDYDVVWATADKTIAAVDDVGNVTGISEGQTSVTATVGSVVAICEVNVTAKEENQEPSGDILVIDGDVAYLYIDNAQKPEDVEAALHVAFDEHGIKRFVLQGKFEKLGIWTEAEKYATYNRDFEDGYNPFWSLNGDIECIDFSGVTDWPDVDLDGNNKTDSATGLPAFSFYKKAVRKVILPEKVVAIGYRAFYSMFEGNTILEECVAPGVGLLGESAFENNYYLKSINFPELISVSKRAFFNCWAISSIIIPKVSKIGEEAFYNCYSLLTFNISGLREIGDGAFENCTKLQNMGITGVETIGKNAFKNCTSLYSFQPVKLKTVGNAAFMNCTSLSVANFFKLEERLNNDVFNGCTKLERVEMPLITAVYDNAFKGCVALKEVKMFKIEYLFGSAFDGCTSLEEVSFPNLKFGSTCTFQNCTSLKSVFMPNLHSGGAWMFCNCSQLTELDFPKLISIEHAMFTGCDNLTTLRLTKSGEILLASSISSANKPFVGFNSENCTIYLNKDKTDGKTKPQIRDNNSWAYVTWKEIITQ